MTVLTNARSNIFAVWFLPAGSSVEKLNRHPADATSADELLTEYEERGDEVIQLRFIRDAADAGDVLYANPRYLDS